jgi:hypothetical protein
MITTTKQKSVDVPILLVIFKRKETSLQIIRAIAKVKPRKLYISQDGPRNTNEETEVVETRKAVLSKIDWECKLTVWTHKKNLGLKKHIPEAFDKFFENEEMGIYLEDDTLPCEEFFYFQEELLKKYKDDKRIFSISGTNFYPKLVSSKDPYYLSKIGDIWGFGLWRRSWKLYNSEMNDFDEVSKTQKYKNYFFNKKYKFYLESFWKAIIGGKLDSWAMQLVYAAIKNDMYFISPSVNMVNNIGINKKASNVSIQSYYQSYGNPFPMNHPKELIYNKKNDLIYFDNMLKGGLIRLILIRTYLQSSDKLKMLVNKFINKILINK